MELSKKGIADRTAFEQKGYALPQFDREEMIAKTKKTPHWIHFGAGNIFRAFQANVMQELLNKELWIPVFWWQKGLTMKSSKR